ncbi:MAG: cobalamin biosynthesis protein CbiX [Caloramator sp.]|uniref:Sirohydrochlorin cobaltochelatase n=1 Tax=Caloramator proteoclasticus DSM 10124 TaxID=1121262 RepID=A0A1M4S8Q3_9CLOT|nr:MULTISPECIES: sirohydrochlorin chelatase [Caloramator]GIW48640.1 MAG: cobalamin biosynthesis protein CbiX [Caloramator sp.]SHE28580.1 sirohydrochlorin cobaltochelatase [Caloramator proteoclasticus DSM 10124]
MKAILLIGHGSRAKEAKDVFIKVSNGLQERVKSKVYIAFMENATPSIEDAFVSIREDGVRYVDVLPYFLFEGIHIKEDIPEILREMKEKYDVEIEFKRPIEYHELIIDILIDRLKGAGICI